MLEKVPQPKSLAATRRSRQNHGKRVLEDSDRLRLKAFGLRLWAHHSRLGDLGLRLRLIGMLVMWQHWHLRWHSRCHLLLWHMAMCHLLRWHLLRWHVRWHLVKLHWSNCLQMFFQYVSSNLLGTSVRLEAVLAGIHVDSSISQPGLNQFVGVS